MNICIMKLMGGEEVVAKVESQPLGRDVYGSPRIIDYSVDAKGSINGIRLVPFFISSPEEKEIKINEALILSTITCPEKLAKVYLESVSGIALLT